MCGIVGYVGRGSATGYLLEGLRRLEYRGYDSAGIATRSDDNRLQVEKTVGRIDALAKRLNGHALQGEVGIGHTRWATHGGPTEENSHPHLGGQGTVAISHNGVIENYQTLKERLAEQGYEFRSATDSEVIAHLIDSQLEIESRSPSVNGTPYTPLIAAVKRALAELQGTYALAMVFRDWPGLLVAARLGSPLVIGIGQGEKFVASDASPLAGYTDKLVYLADHELAVVTADDLLVTHRDLGRIKHRVAPLPDNSGNTSLDGYPHHMLKEIFEQPQSLRQTLEGRICEDDATAVFDDFDLTAEQLRNVSRVVLTACGTSWHAAIAGEYMLEGLARVPVEVQYASELRYRNPPLERDTLLFAITQSGETADTLAALREMRRKGYRTLAICNVVGSTIAREADGRIYLSAGPEIGVASTKAYTSQLMALALLVLYFGRLRHLSFDKGRRLIEILRQLPQQVEQALETNDEVRRIAEKYCDANNFLYLGRQCNFSTALEGALKLKEISYVHAEGYPAAEMKHGPIALVDEQTPSVFVIPRDFVYDKVMANIEEIKARGGPVIAVADEGDERVAALADDVIYVPKVEEFFQPFVSVVPLQLLAYHIAVLRGCDVDKPRNLAKSVTVE